MDRTADGRLIPEAAQRAGMMERTAVPQLIGMVHLPALPGAPGFDGDRGTVREHAVADAEALEAGGIGAVRRAVDVPVGVNVLRSDGPGAMAVAAATGASFVRVNVHTGARLTDQGVIEGRAHETLRLRDRLDADKVRVLADIDVKHSASLAERPLAEVARETVERGGADGLVVSGPATGKSVNRGRLERIATVADETGVPLVVGSGVTPGTVTELLTVADACIVGTALKRGGETTAPVDHERVAELVAAATDG